MKKTKLKQRINNAVNAFFENDHEQFEENSLSFAADSALLKQEAAAPFFEKGDIFVKILKRTFLFLPGAFYLFFGTISVFLFEVWSNPPAVLAAFLIGSFMTIFGIGNIKNPKHLFIPLSIVAVAIFAFSFFSVVGNIKYIFEYGIYFFPMALIASVLAKNWADKAGEIKEI